jgi:hypothetical protein
MMAGLVRWNPFDELQKLTDTFDRFVNRWSSSSAWSESPSYASTGSVSVRTIARPSFTARNRRLGSIGSRPV